MVRKFIIIGIHLLKFKSTPTVKLNVIVFNIDILILTVIFVYFRN